MTLECHGVVAAIRLITSITFRSAVKVNTAPDREIIHVGDCHRSSVYKYGSICGDIVITVAAVDKNRKPIPGTEEFIECDTLLLSVGLIPENEISTGCGVAIDGCTSGPIVNERMQTSVEGVFACGNTVHVHDLVDFVTAESLRAGENAAKYVQGKKAANPQHITLRPGNRVRYTVPQYIESTENEGNTSIMFRSTDVYRDVTIVVSSNNERLRSIRKKIVRPGEMQVVELKPEQLAKVKDDITVAIELPEEDVE